MIKYHILNKKFLDNKKIKTIIIFIILIIFFTISYFIYADSETKELLTDDDILMNNSTKENNQNINNLNTNENNISKENKKIIVHVDGEVNNPGIVELKEGDRISNAIEIAGGIKENADLKNINLAFLVEDGMKIYVPANNNEKGDFSMENFYENNLNNNSLNITEKNLDDLEKVTKESGGTSLEAFVNTEKNSKNNLNNKININTASQADLETLPGIGSATALKIINYRNSNGKFNSIEDIKNVKGIGDSKFENIKDFIVCK
ncbi:MAG: helix-hairpin-helix domain-containing protein [Clostridia bacterium]|nr:helix-hairpin-helix domain-containing protein [Clostridia bacterium]